MVSIAIAFVCGILCSAAKDARVDLACVFGAIAVVISGHRHFHRIAIATVIAFTLGVADGKLRSAEPITPDRHYVTLQAVVEESREFDESASALVLRLPGGSRASAVLTGSAPPIGERLTLRARREPFDEARNPGEVAEREIEAERGIACRLIHARVTAREPPDPGDATLWLPRAREWGSLRIHALLGEPDATILAGAMWGERGTLPPELRAEFQDTGTVHVLVTAGLHLGVIAALALGAFAFCRMGRVAASLSTIPVIWTYAALSGTHLPSMRAATMLTFALVARASGRDAFSWNGLALAAIVVAALRPQAVASLSFALSFSCVAAIFAFAHPCAELLERIFGHHGIAQLFGVALATQLGTWPLTAYGFLVIAPYAPLANAAVVPVVGIAMLAGFAAILATPIPPLAHAIANIAISLVDWIAGVVRFVALIPGAHVIATPPPEWTIAAYDAALVLLALTISRERFVRASIVLVIVASAICVWPPRRHEPGLIVTAIDVGQADSLLIQTPHGHAYLVDGGGRLESGSSQNGVDTAEALGERIVVPFLIRRGIHHLDAIILSHPHGDHVGGMAPVLRTLGANGFADSGQIYAGHAYHDALDVAESHGIPMLEPRAGDVWRTEDGVTFRFYGPSLPYITHSRSDINSNSLVFRMEYGDESMLFTGDAGEETERRLLSSGVDLRATVLKVGHHGSAYGSTPEFVRAVSPQFAIVSVGRHNLFGHPAPSTLETLSRAGTQIYRTDRDGAVTIIFDGRSAVVRPFLRAF